MNRMRAFSTAIVAALVLAASPAPAKTYLAGLSAASGTDTVTLHLRIRGAAAPRVAYRPDAVQVTLSGAFLDPAKQHLAVEHPAVREVFAYQYDPDTVRVRIFTQGMDARTLADAVALSPEPGGLRLTLHGLPASAPPAVVPAAPESEAPRAASEAGTQAPAPQAASPVAMQADVPEPEPAPPVARIEGPDAAAAARTDALEAFERILAGGGAAPATDVKPEPTAAPEPLAAPQSGPAAAPSPLLAATRVIDGSLGGGMPAVAEPPVEAVPAESEPGAVTAPARGAREDAATEPPAAPEHAAPAPDALGLRPLNLLPHAGGQAPDLWSSGVRMAGGLLTVLALLLAGVAGFRRLKGTSLGGRVPIRVLASASVGSRQNIVVVEVDGRRLVVGVGPGGTELLADLEAGPQAAAAGAGGSDPASGTFDPGPGRGATPFARALQAAGRKGIAGQSASGKGARLTKNALARTTRDLERQVRRLRERSA